MAIINKKAEQFLEKYLNNAAPTSNEAPGQKIWLEYLKPYVDKCAIDNYGTCYGVINPDAKFKVVLEAHADEISWYVSYISDDGFLYVMRNGGSDHMIAPAKRVNIYSDKGIVRGVFGWPAIHLRKGADANLKPTMDNIFVDVGAKNKKEVLEMGIRPGTVLSYPDPFEILNDKYYVCRAIDNRAGGFMIAQVARMLKENKKKVPFGLYIVNSVMEEVGLRGASMITDTIKPNVAIVTDVTHDTSTPMIEAVKHGDVRAGLGPTITYGPACHNNLNALIRKTAQQKKIPLQLEAASRSTGTDTDAFAFSNGGVVSALISLPLRYMHTTVEMVAKEDVENTIKLMYETILKIKNNHDFKYFKV